MNIFVPYKCPIESARYLDNKRVIKMILESAQLLSSAMHLNGGVGPYRLTHKSHPCTIWTATTLGNFNWVYRHYLALCDEYRRRYNKTHKCESLRQTFEAAHQFIRAGDLQSFVNCTPYKRITDVHLAYQLCLNDKFLSDVRPAISTITIRKAG